MAEIIEGAPMPRRSKAILNNLLQNRQISPMGVNYLVAASDPFHDTEVTVDGFPDMTSAKVITQVVTKTVSVTFSGTTTWESHVMFCPITPTWTQATSMTTTTKRASTELSTKTVSSTLSSPAVGSVSGTTYMRASINDQGTLGLGASATQLQAGWNCISTPTGTNWISSTATTTYSDLAMPREYCTGAYRLIASGLEVVNTTADLYRGGSVVCYRSPSNAQASSLNTVYTSVGVTQIVSHSGKLGLMPPTTVADATLYPNSRTWNAEEGCYLVATLNDSDNPFVTPMPGFGGLISPSDFDDMSSGAGWLAYLPLWTDADLLQPGSLSGSCTTVLPYDITGSIFSGLLPQTTLRVTARYYIERHPSIADPNLLVLARTPCPYDPVILEILSRTMQHLPVGVRVGENPLGEWFNDIMRTVGEWAPKIGKLVGVAVPGLENVGNAVGLAARGALKINGGSAQPRKEKKTARKERVANSTKKKPKQTAPDPNSKRQRRLRAEKFSREAGTRNYKRS